LQKTGSEHFALKLDSFADENQEGIGFPFAPLRRGPEGPLLEEQGTILSVVPVSTKKFSFVNLSVRKIKPALVGKCMAMAVACVGTATEPGSRENTAVGLCAIKIVVLTSAVEGVEKIKEILV
jgi:hypothetical protein